MQTTLVLDLPISPLVYVAVVGMSQGLCVGGPWCSGKGIAWLSFSDATFEPVVMSSLSSSAVKIPSSLLLLAIGSYFEAM